MYLRTDKKTIKTVVKLLYPSANSIRTKKDGSIVIKKHWWSIRKKITSVEEILNFSLPHSIKTFSKDAAEDYALAMLNLGTSNFKDRIDTAFIQFSSFISETGFSGLMLDWDFDKSFSEKFVNAVKQKKNNIRTYFNQLELDFKVNRITNNRQLIALKAMPSEYVVPVKEVLSKTFGECVLEPIAVITTGNSEYDKKLQRVWRIVSI